MVFGRGKSAATGTRSRDAKVSLRASGDRGQGYQAVILLDCQPVAQSGEGEFSAVFQNSDRSLEQRVENWRAASCTGTDDHLLLGGECELTKSKRHGVCAGGVSRGHSAGCTEADSIPPGGYVRGVLPTK